MQDWERVKDIFGSALEQPVEMRPEFLRQQCDGDENLLAEVESLLAAHDEPENLVEKNSFDLASNVASNGRSFAGKQFGNYKIIREIGRGGMGAVFLAKRTDGEFDQQVALKIVRQTFANAELEKHFRRERQILANLNHRNIARLLDGGVSEMGEPFLAMEYVEGEPLLEYVEKQNLNIKDRLNLFLKICLAVSYAHRNLTVHRDIKPSNILVTSDGEPKLLDFGLAKMSEPPVLAGGLDMAAIRPLTNAGGSDLTQTAFRAFTPAYASPEQIQGKNITTASDVYSLGVVLYELLTNERPFNFENKSFEEILRTIGAAEAARPSSILRMETKVQSPRSENEETNPQSAIRNPQSLRGDLDTIILKALRKEPEMRYESVEQFAQDIERHLSDLPILARPQTFSYRASRFVRRNKIAVGATVFVILSLITGLTFALWQANIARADRRRAERRFNDLRKLANSNLFELHDAIEQLPGSTPARELLVKRALEYMDSLAQEANNDPSLARELVAAYIKVGNVQGNPNNANLGDTTGALRSYSQARSIAEQLLTANPTDAETLWSLGIVQEKMSDVQSAIGDLPGAVENAQRSLAAFQSLADGQSENIKAQQSIAISNIKVGDVLGNPNFPNKGDPVEAMNHYRVSLLILQFLKKADPNDFKTRRFLGVIHERIGTMLERDGNIVEAQGNYRESQMMRDDLARSYPDNTDVVRDAAIAHEKMGNVLKALGNFRSALESRRQSLEIFSRLASADPQNRQAQQSLAISYMHLGDLLGDPDSLNPERRAEALKAYRRSMEILQTIISSDLADSKARSTVDIIRDRIQRLEQ